jgi:hypothetical protein
MSLQIQTMVVGATGLIPTYVNYVTSQPAQSMSLTAGELDNVPSITTNTAPTPGADSPVRLRFRSVTY